MPKSPKPLTAERVAAFEQLLPRLEAMLKQLGRPRAGQPAPKLAVAMARAHCDAAKTLLGRETRGLPPLPADPDLATVALAIGQAVAALQGFRAAHTAPDASGQPAWQLSDGATAPLADAPEPRPRPPARGTPVPDDIFEPTPEEARSTVLKRIVQRENAVYMKGWRDGRDGKPPREPRTWIEII